VKNDVIVATGYNGTIRGALNCGEDIPCLKDLYEEAPYTSYEHCPAVHAEENACLIAGRERALGGTLYLAPILGEGDRPCSICRRKIVQVGLTKVVFIGRDGNIYIDDVEDYVKMEDEGIMKELETILPDYVEVHVNED